MARQINDMPSKFREVVFKSSLIQPGPPDRYQLVTKKESLDGENEKASQLRRWTFGQKDPKKDNKTILMVGQTGSGKSTLINAMANYIMGVEFNDKIWFEIVDTGTRSQCESQTSEVTVYEIFGFEGSSLPYSLTIIDTPGFGDTKGIENDEIVPNKLHDLFRSEKGIQEIDAVGFVVKASENRLGDTQKYVFNAVVDLFGKDMEKNIVILMTHSDGLPPKNALEALEKANVKCLKDEKNNKAVNFMFNNRQGDIITEDTESASQSAWMVSWKGMGGFFKFLEHKEKRQQIKTTLAVLREHIRLRACIGNLKERIELSDKKENEMIQIKTVLDKHTHEMQENENFTFEVEESYKVKEEIDNWWDYKAVSCLTCEETCHHPGCTIASSPWWCEVMKKDDDGDVRCTSCRGKCCYTEHVKENWRFVTKTRVVVKTYDEMKSKYKTSQKEAQQKESVLSGLEAEIKKIQNDKNEMVAEAYQCVLSLEAIALNAYSRSVHKHMDFLIEKLKETGNKMGAKRLEDMKKLAE